jgi:hypothetical protein
MKEYKEWKSTQMIDEFLEIIMEEVKEKQRKELAKEKK